MKKQNISQEQQIQQIIDGNQTGEGQKKKPRRSRGDYSGRNFTCKCGKSYLSYPALYTHMKTKHVDQPFPKLAKTYQNKGQNHHSSYGQKQQNQLSQKQIEKMKQKQILRQRQKEKEKERQKQKQLEQPLYGNSLPQVNNIEVLRQFLFKYYPNVAVSNNNSRIQMGSQQRKQLKSMRDYWNNGRKKQQEPFLEVYDTKINHVLGKFLTEIQNDIQNVNLKKFICNFIFAIKKALDKIKDEKYFKQSNAADLPLYFDQILRQHFLLDNHQTLSNPTVGARCLYHLARWLYVNKFTNMSLKYNF